MLIGRKREIDELNALYSSDEAELVALYGRRRVGKTYLINETFKGRFSFMHAGLSPIEVSKNGAAKATRMKEQLLHFYHSLLTFGMKPSKCPTSWIEAFYMLETLLSSKCGGEKQVVFFDEIQWMDTPKSGFMTGFEAFWNGWACGRHNIMVIVCGSSTSWVLDKLINNHGGLYNRVTKQIRLNPFSLSECEEYLIKNGFNYSRYDIVQTYMVFGGIPYYLKHLDRSKSFAQNIDDLFFEGNAPFQSEFDRLFQSIFVNPETMQAIIKAIGSKKSGLTRQELLDSLKIQDSGSFSKFLKALMEGGFIFKYVPFGAHKREERFKLIDPFCLFYIHFYEKRGRKDNWSNNIDSQGITVWRGIAFENVCFNHIKQIKSKLGISGVSTNESLWLKKGDNNEEGTQIDLIIDRKDNIIDLCEAKFWSDEFVIDKNYHFSLVRRKAIVQKNVSKKKTVQNILISTYGLRKNEYSWDFSSIVTMDDLFKD